jgi:Cysteine-rich secretory protein family
MALTIDRALRRPTWKRVENGWRRMVCFALAFGSLIAALPAHAESPAEMISSFRLQHGEGRVTADPVLNRIAHDQAAAMAAKDVLDHDVLGQFSSRVAPSGSGQAAENIAYGYDSFPKTLNQWIDSSGHRKNLLLHGASRIGVASVKSATTGRTYWAMEIAGDYERAKPSQAKPSKANSKPSRASSTTAAKPGAHVAQACRLKILSLCL